MEEPAVIRVWRDFPAMCRPDGNVAALWLAQPDGRRLAAALGMILVGGGTYGFTLGFWRSPTMGAYVAAKVPILLLAVTLCTGLLNGMVAQLLGSRLSFRQSLLATLLSFAIFSVILGALGPVTLGLAWTLEGPDSARAGTAYAILLVVNTAAIAAAGVLAHSRFLPALIGIVGDQAVAKRVFLAWLLANLFVGAQLSWNLRPFFGHPGNPEIFLRPNWNEGNFYETLATHVESLGSGTAVAVGLAVVIAVLAWAFGFVGRKGPASSRFH